MFGTGHRVGPWPLVGGKKVLDDIFVDSSYIGNKHCTLSKNISKEVDLNYGCANINKNR